MQALIREATPGDAPSLRACIAAAFSHYIARIGKPPAPMLLDIASEIDAGHVWLAQVRGEVCGVLVQYDTPIGFYVDTVGVLPQLHGTGVGKALLQFAEREARRRGFDSICLCTNSKMTENQVLYPRIGYVETERKAIAGYDRIFYRKSLNPPRATP